MMLLHSNGFVEPKQCPPHKPAYAGFFTAAHYGGVCNIQGGYVTDTVL